jgi:foldase protein PrsA
MATKKKKTIARKSELKVSVPKKAVRKKTSEMEFSDFEITESAPKTKIITRKYLYAVLIVLALIGILFTASRFWIVAWVDNKPITKFELYSLLEKRDEGKTAEELIVQRLLLSEGQKQKQTVSESETETEIKKIEEQQGGAEQLDQILQIQRLSREDFRKLVELQLLKQKLFSSGVEITKDEVEKYLEENKASLPANILNNPESSEAAKLRDSAKEQLKQLKVNENFNNWLNENLKGSRVIRS